MIEESCCLVGKAETLGWKNRSYLPSLIRYPSCLTRLVDFVSAFLFCFFSVCRKESFLSWVWNIYCPPPWDSRRPCGCAGWNAHPKQHMGPWSRKLNWLQAPILPIGRVDISEWPCSFFPLMKELVPIYLVEQSYFWADLSMHHSLEIPSCG